ncbi:MAG: HD domain-containing phosphohydrolase [Candidatus Omnitrophota bacterium]|jgi:putative nucleotidyltransferase with HDIG domain
MMDDIKQFHIKEVIPALSLIMDYQANCSLYHAFRVAVVAYLLSSIVSPKLKDINFYAGLLHDIGLFETGEHLVTNYKELNFQKTYPPFRNHPITGASIVKEIPGLSEAVMPILDHHEYFDGSGYPYGKKREDISTCGQVLRIADSFDLFLRRKSGIDQREVSSFIKAGSGREFSPQLCSSFLELDCETLSKIRQEDYLKEYFCVLVGYINEPKVKIRNNERDIFLHILGRAIDGKHHYTNQHSFRVARYADKIAEKMELDNESRGRAKAAGYLHDIGKLAIPNSILDKLGPLTQEEWRVIKTHPKISYEITNSVKYFKDLKGIVFSAQEEYDGTGYPKGLKAEDIPLEARIISVADAVDAMLSDRAYRKALPLEKAIDELRENSGTQFDPHVASTAIDLLNPPSLN